MKCKTAVEVNMACAVAFQTSELLINGFEFFFNNIKPFDCTQLYEMINISPLN